MYGAPLGSPGYRCRPYYQVTELKCDIYPILWKFTKQNSGNSKHELFKCAYDHQNYKNKVVIKFCKYSKIAVKIEMSKSRNLKAICMIYLISFDDKMHIYLFSLQFV